MVSKVKKSLRMYQQKGVGDIVNSKANNRVTGSSIEDLLKEVMDDNEPDLALTAKRGGERWRKSPLSRVLTYACWEEKLDVGFLGRMLVGYTRSLLLKVFKFVIDIYNRDSLRALREKRVWTRQLVLSSMLSATADPTTEYARAAVDKVYLLLLRHNQAIAQDIAAYRDEYRVLHPTA